MATEKRLIDANAMLNAIDAYMLSAYDCLLSEVAEFQDNCRNIKTIYAVEGLYEATLIIEEQPTVDAVEVVHGRWIEKVDIVASYLADCEETFYECSVCNSPNFGESPYCPNCGAKMDGDGNVGV